MGYFLHFLIENKSVEFLLVAIILVNIFQTKLIQHFSYKLYSLIIRLIYCDITWDNR